MPAPTGRTLSDPIGLLGAELLGRYVVESPLARGGMSMLYRGHDSRLRRPVCVKVFHRIDPADPAYRTAHEHFVQEAFALSQLSHPNTLRIYDFGYLDGESQQPYHVSELCDGGTLAQRVRRQGPASPQAALELLEPLVGALAEAHARGIVHRDIKPTNILFTSAGATRLLKLVDFGIAKAGLESSAGDLPHRAQDTAVAAGLAMSLHSPGWAAPEQLRAEVIGPWTDVFALGLVLFYVMTGRTIFHRVGDGPDFADGERGDAYIEAELAKAGLAPAIGQVIARACREHEYERFGSVDALLTAFRGAVNASAAAPPPTPAPPRAPPAAGPELVLVPPRAPDAPPAPPDAPPLHLVDPGVGDRMIVAGRQLRVIAVGEQLDAGGSDGPLRSLARFRLTLLPDRPGLRLHLKGLNCFVARQGARPSSAATLGEGGVLELIAPDRRPLDRVRCVFGVPAAGGVNLFALGDASLAVPARLADAVIVDLGPGRETVLLHPAAGPKPEGTR